MPSVETVSRQRGCMVLGGIKDDLADALDIAIGRCERANLDAEPSRDRGSHFVTIEDLSLYLARFDDLFGQALQVGLGLQRKAQVLHAAEQSSLSVTDGSELGGDTCRIPLKVGPLRELMDICDHCPRLLRRL